mgnify:FL=1
MNPNIDAEVQQLKVYLDQYPHEAAQLAVNHLEDYLVQLKEFKHLQDQIELFKQSKTFKVSLDLDSSNNTQLTLEQKFRVERLKRSLASEPNHNQAKFWAVEYFKFFLHLNESYLEKRAELISLNNKPSLPYFL